MKVFEQYVKKFDMNNNNIKTKYFHSLKVMELSNDIATTIGLFNEDEIAVVEIIALFHEIANFTIVSNKNIGEDDVEDYALKSVEILFNEGLLRKITDDTRYDEIIKLAIYAGDKNGLPNNISPKDEAFCKILRDAHRLDNYRMILNYPIIDSRIDVYPTNMVYDNFKLFRVIDKKLGENNADEIIIILSDVFGLNYRYTYAVLQKNDYIDRIINSLKYNDKKLQNFFLQIGKVINVYISRRIGG